MLYGFELDKTVTLRQVLETLEKVQRSGGGGSIITVDLGDAGYHDVECECAEPSLDAEGIVRRLANESV